MISGFSKLSVLIVKGVRQFVQHEPRHAPRLAFEDFDVCEFHRFCHLRIAPILPQPLRIGVILRPRRLAARIPRIEPERHAMEKRQRSRRARLRLMRASCFCNRLLGSSRLRRMLRHQPLVDAQGPSFHGLHRVG